MPRSERSASKLWLAVVLGLLVVVAAGLLHRRFEQGDVYPPYSSLRSDPLGSEVLLESLRQLPGLSVRRNMEPLDRMRCGPGATLLVLGANVTPWQEDDAAARRLTALAQQGCRVVLTLNGRLPRFLTDLSDLPFSQEEDDTDEEDADGNAGEESEADGDDAGQEESGDEGNDDTKPWPALQHWGLSLAIRDLPQDRHTVSGHGAVTVALRQDLALPEPLPWHSPLVLTRAPQPWRVIYARGEEPVLVERQQGPGSLVVATDTYLLSNQALLADRQPALLAWLVGEAETVVFDELHLGVVRQEGVMMLIRRYRLLGFFAALAVLALLYLWRAALPFAPPSALAPAGTDGDGGDGGDGDQAPMRSSQEALVNLLRRGLRSNELLTTFAEAWQRSSTGSVDPALLHRVQQQAQQLSAAGSDPVEGYRRLTALLSAHRRGTATKIQDQKTGSEEA